MLDAGSAMSVFHNEVAPSQYELSPIFKLTNVAMDENTMCMEILNEVAARHGLYCLMHEKPFAGEMAVENTITGVLTQTMATICLSLEKNRRSKKGLLPWSPCWPVA